MARVLIDIPITYAASITKLRSNELTDSINFIDVPMNPETIYSAYSATNWDFGTMIGFDDEFVRELITQEKNSDAKVYFSIEFVDAESLYLYASYYEGVPDESNFTKLNDYRLGLPAYIASSNQFDVSSIFYDHLFSIKGLIFESINAYELRNPRIKIEGEWIPNRPSLVAPVGGIQKDRTKPIEFTWNHQGVFEQAKFNLRYRKIGTSDWTTITAQSTEQKHTLPANSLDAAEYEWQVRTYYDDAINNEPSPWSLTQVFNATEATNQPNIISPTTGQVLPTQDLYIQWETVPNQTQFEVELVRGNQVIRNIVRTSSNNSVTLNGWLDNNESYIVRLRVLAAGQFWSDWASVNISVAYTEPAKAILTITPNDPFLEIDIHNPVPIGTQPNALSNDLFRRKKGSSNWVRIAKALIPNSKYYDYAVANKTEYEYRVTTFGDNDTTSTSNTYNGILTFKFDVISLANEPSNFVKLFLNPQRSFSKNFNAAKKHFSGRKLPTIEFGEVVDSDSSLSYLVNETDYIKLDEMASRQETLLYRDIRGRKQYITINTLTTTDDIKYRDFYIVDLSISQVDYDEAVT